jgi:outer membrane phospholipase A
MKWPAFREMSLQEQANFVNRLAEMRQRIRAQALKKAADLGIRLTPEQEQAFIASYLQERMAIEKKIWQETQAKRRELDEQLKSNLRKQYAGEPPEPPAAAAR